MPKRSIIFPRGMVRAAGAIVWRIAPGAAPVPPGVSVSPADMQVLIVHRPRYRDWSWPKGKANLNEPLAVAAVREVEEETGRVVALGAPMTTQRYRLGSGHLKEVYYWVGQQVGKGPARSTRRPVSRATKREIDVVQWVSPDRARDMLTRRGDRRLLTELVGRASRGHLQTSTLMLLRHARAVSRDKWGGLEAERPLSRMGVAQTLDLVPLLSAFGISSVVSSPWRRCEQTVAPYATLGGVPLQLAEPLTEDATALDPGAASNLVEGLLQGERKSVVVSFHGPGLQALEVPLRALAARRVLTAMDRPRPELRKAEMLVAHVTVGESRSLLEVERHRPLTKIALA